MAKHRNDEFKKAKMNRRLLVEAISIGSLTDVKFLVEECGAVLTKPWVWSSWEYPTRLATQRRDGEILRYLISKGASLSDANGEPVIFAVLAGYEEDFERTSAFFDVYVEVGGNLDVADGFDRSFLDQLIQSGWLRLAAKVLQYGGKHVYQSLFNKFNLQVEGFAQGLIALLLGPSTAQYSPTYMIEQLELVGSLALQSQFNLISPDYRVIEDCFISDIHSWLQAIHLRNELELLPQWHTRKQPYTNVEPVSSNDELMRCIHLHAHGDMDLVVQCLLTQERLAGTIDVSIAKHCACYHWNSARQYIDLMIYISHFDVDMYTALVLPQHCERDMDLAQVCTLIDRILSREFSRESESWVRAVAEFLVDIYDAERYPRYQLQQQAREINLEQRVALETLVSRQSIIEDMDADLVRDLLPARREVA